MPKIKFDLDQVNYTEFRTKEDYDRDSYSSAGYDRWHNARNQNKPYSGPCYRYSSDPIKFPCIQIEVKIWDNSNGPYEIDCIYIYDYELGEDPSEDQPYGHDFKVDDSIRRISGEDRVLKIGETYQIKEISEITYGVISLKIYGHSTWWHATNFERIK